MAKLKLRFPPSCTTRPSWLACFTEKTSFILQYPPKTAQNRKVANICDHCRNYEKWYAELAAQKLRDGIVHLTIDQLDTAREIKVEEEVEVDVADITRLWETLIDRACNKGCGCAQTLRQHLYCDELKDFWEATVVETSAVTQPSRRQRKKEAKKMQENPTPVPLGKRHAENRRHKKAKARAKQASAAAIQTTDDVRAPPNLPAAGAGLSNDFKNLHHALPTIHPITQPLLPVKTALGLPVTFTATLPLHRKSL